MIRVTFMLVLIVSYVMLKLYTLPKLEKPPIHIESSK